MLTEKPEAHKITSHAHTTFGNDFLMECRWKLLQSRRAAQALRSGTDPLINAGAGEGI